MGRGPGRARALGFTVVELMIVILLIAMLIAIAVPAFHQAQARARRMACRNNLRQVYVALSNYAAAHNGMLPTNEPGGEGIYPWPPGRETPGLLGEDVSRNWIGTRSQPWGLGKLHVELGDDLRVLFCPNDGRRDPDAYRQAFLNDQMLDSGDTVDCSYLFRGRDAPDKVDTAAIRLFRARNDSVRALVMDYYHAGMTNYHHGDRICVLFERGHTLDVRVSLPEAPDRFVDPRTGPAALNVIWRRADQLYESDD
jgi:type II secretory pathway pseudopilin PulG